MRLSGLPMAIDLSMTFALKMHTANFASNGKACTYRRWPRSIIKMNGRRPCSYLIWKEKLCSFCRLQRPRSASYEHIKKTGKLQLITPSENYSAQVRRLSIGRTASLESQELAAAISQYLSPMPVILRCLLQQFRTSAAIWKKLSAVLPHAGS